MATTLQAVIGLSDKLTSDLTTRRGAWRQYLNTAARVYKYSFSDQLLIYGQRPDATACAELPLWNEKMGRWVNRGAHGIALIDTSRRRPRLRYVFDVSDTHLSRTAAGGRCACGPSGQTSMRLSPKSWSACTRMPASPA